MTVAARKAERLERPLKNTERSADRPDRQLDQIVNDFLNEFEADYRQRIDKRKKNKTEKDA